MKFEVVINQNGAYFFRLISANNGNILASSEAYSSKAKCVQTVKAIAIEFNLQYDSRDLTAEVGFD